MSLIRKRRTQSAIVLPWESRSLWFGPRSLFRQSKVLLGSIALGLVWIWAWCAYREAERVRETQLTIAEVKNVILNFRQQMGRCPHNVSELLAPARSNLIRLRYQPTDAWGKPLKMICPGHFHRESVDVVSAGPDGLWNNDDGIY